MEAKAALLILLLLSDPQAEPLGTQVSTQLVEHAQAAAKQAGEAALPPPVVLAGKEALAKLREIGLEQADLLANPDLGKQLTRSAPGTILIYLDRRANKGSPNIPDSIQVDAQMWWKGQQAIATTIVGGTDEPVAQVVSGVIENIGPVLAPKPPPGTAGVEAAPAPTFSAEDLAAMAKREQWMPLLGAVASLPAKEPRHWYYQIQAYVGLQQFDAAITSLKDMKSALPQGHFLIQAATDLIPASAMQAPPPSENPLAPAPAPAVAPAPAPATLGENPLAPAPAPAPAAKP